MIINRQQLASSFRTSLATVAMAAACFAIPVTHASTKISSNGGAACKASNGNGAKLFYFANLYAENTSTTDQYLTCQVPQISPNSTRAANEIDLMLLNTTAVPRTFTCVITAGYLPFTINSAIYVIEVPANSNNAIISNAGSTPAIPPRTGTFDPYDVSCLVPAGGRVGAIASVIPETI